MKRNFFLIVLLTIFSLDKIAAAQTVIPEVGKLSPEEAGLHLGEKKEVDGFIYKIEVKITGKKAMLLTYISDQKRLKPMFIKVIDKIATKQDKDGTIKTANDYWGLNLTHIANWHPTSEVDEKAIGKIVMYNGLPAIIINEKDIQSFETTYKADEGGKFQ